MKILCSMLLISATAPAQTTQRVNIGAYADPDAQHGAIANHLAFVDDGALTAGTPAPHDASALAASAPPGTLCA